MSDSDESVVTHSEISSPFEDLSNITSPGVVGPEHEGLSWMLDDPYVQVVLQAPPSPDYIPGLEEPQSPPLPGFIPEPQRSAPSAEETEPFETDESTATPPPNPAYHVTARISIPTLVPTPVWSDAEIPLPPLPPIPSPSLPVSTLSTVSYLPSPPATPPLPPPSLLPTLIRPPHTRAAMAQRRATAPPIILSHTRPNAPSSGTPPLHLLSTDHREDRPEVTLPPRKRLGIALGPRYEVGESLSAAAARPAGGLRADYGFVATIDREIRRDLERDVGYGITDSWDEIVEAMQGTPVVADVAKFSQRMTKFETRVRRDTYEVYTRLDDKQTGRQLLAGRLNMLFRDSRVHARTARLMETKARMS
ncbi:hypothetical protein Tco_0546164 [Tanacetum coccineum]